MYNTDRFNIERSITGATYSTISTVTAVSSGDNHYSFIDKDAAVNNYYYRIRVVDKDGHISYSPFITLFSNGEGKTTVYPNPAGNGTYLRMSDKRLLNTTALIYNS